MSRVKGVVDFMRKLAESQQRVTKPVSGDVFADAVGNAASQQKGNFMVSDFLTKYTPEEYSQMQTFLNKDKTAGYALKRITDDAANPNRQDLVSVFNVGDTPGIGPRLAAEGTVRGATNLDNFDVQGVLPRLYGKAGFEEIPGQRFPFDPAEAKGVSDALVQAAPDYVEMQLSPQRINDLLRTRFLTADEYLKYMETGKLPPAKLKSVQNAVLAAMGAGTAAGTAGILE